MHLSAHRLFGHECSPKTLRETVSVALLSGLLVVTAILAVLASSAGAQLFEAKLWQQDSQFADEFGRTVFLSGGTVVVTEPGSDDTGVLHVYERIGKVWTALTNFTAPDAAAGARFGDALWLDGDTLAVGAPYDAQHGTDAGAVYVFERDRAGTPGDPTDDRWSPLAKLYPAAGPVPGRFGSALCLRGGMLLVGAPGGGAGYVFVRDSQGTPGDPFDDTWIEQVRFSPVSSGSQLGRAVLLLPGAHTALLGGDREPGGSEGIVRVVHRDDQGTPADPLDDAWLEVDALAASDGGSAFGRSLAFAGSTLLVGGGYHAGAPGMAFVGAYELDEGGTPGVPADDAWTPGGELTDPGWPMFSGFGSTVALTEGPGPQVALVNAGGFDWSGPPPFGGILRQFAVVGGRWVFQDNLQAPDDGVGDGFGDCLVIDGERAVIGARGSPYDDMIEEPAVEGAAWVLDLASPSPWSKPWYGRPLAGWGIVDAGWPVSLRLYKAETSLTPVVLVLGLSAIYAPFKGETMVPLPQMLITLVPGPNQDVAMGGLWPTGIPSGTELWCQVWFPPHPGGLWHFSEVVVATQP